MDIALLKFFLWDAYLRTVLSIVKARWHEELCLQAAWFAELRWECLLFSVKM